MYNTFEKASFDQFITASICKNTTSENVANKYIDSITGSGSLNNHFKTMYRKMNKFDSADINKILNDSLYPVLKIDTSNKFRYFPELGVSIMNNKLYRENLSDNKELPKLLIPEGEFQDADVELGKTSEAPDFYEVHFQDDDIYLYLTKKVKVQIEKGLFQEMVDEQVNQVDDYEGEVYTSIEGTDWKLLTTTKYNDVTDQSKESFYYNGDQFQITNKYVKKTTIGLKFGLYLYKEAIYNYIKQNRKYCELVMDKLYDSGGINTFKVKELAKIIDQLKNEDKQRYLNYLLDVKDSKDLTHIGFDLIYQGLVKDWSKGAKSCFVKYMKTDKELLAAYKVNPSHAFKLSELLKVYQLNRSILTDIHLQEVKDYQDNRTAKIKEMEGIIGEISLSGRREKSKELDNIKVVKRYRKLSHKLQGHFDADIKSMSDSNLDKLYKDVLEYQKLDREIEKLIERKEEKNNKHK